MPRLHRIQDMAWVYILECEGGFLYVGSTQNLDERTAQHDTTRVGYTSRRKPLRLLWAEEFETIADAWIIERQLHGWSRAKKMALVEGRSDALPALAARRTRTRPPDSANEV